MRWCSRPCAGVDRYPNGNKVRLHPFLAAHAHICPIEFEHFGRTLLRVPFFWSDDYEIGRKVPRWSLTPYLNVEGLKVFNFTPFTSTLILRRETLPILEATDGEVK